MANKRTRRPVTPPAAAPTEEQRVLNEGAADSQKMLEIEKGAIIQGESEKTDIAPPDPGKILIRIKDKNVTVLPAEEDPAELAEAAEQLKRAQEQLEAAFAPAAEIIRRNQQIRQALVTPAIEEMLQQSRTIKQALYNPAMEAYLQTQYQHESAIAEYGKIIAAAMRSPVMDAMQDMVNAMQTNLERITRTFQGMQDIFNMSKMDSVRQALEQISVTAPAWLELLQEISELNPYLEAEIQKPEYEGKTLLQLRDEADPNDTGEPAENSLFLKALAAARAARDADAAKEEIPHTAITRAQSVEYPLDKPNSKIWNLLEKDTQGQVAFNMAKYGSKQSFLAYYAINFDDLSDNIKITKRLTPTDKRVYIAVSALFNAGNTVITLSQIYYAMGYTGRPGTRDLQQINDAITKMTTARIYFDNEQEAAHYKKYDHFKYDGSLLPLERGTVIVNGKLADAAIKIFREPPLITFAKNRKQITTLDVKLLQSPMSKTDANLLIEDYLLERISREKLQRRKGKSCRILFATLYKNVGIPDKPKTNSEKSMKKRASGKIETYLKHYQQQGFISSFTMEQDGITIHWK